MSNDSGPGMIEKSAESRSGFLNLLRGPAGRRALLVALVVGTVLNLINQGEAVLAHGQVHYLRAALTYMVPFFVSLHGAASATGAAKTATK